MFYDDVLKEKTEIAIIDVSEVLKQAEKLHPYKEIGNLDSYCDYNQGWSDAVDYIASMLGVEY